MPPKDDLSELGWIIYGFVAAAFLVGGVVAFVKGHHSVNFSLTVGSWMVTFAALAWGFRRRRGVAGEGTHVHQAPLSPGQEEDFEVGGVRGRRAVKRVGSPPS
jgi:hypothetical protein